MGEPTLLPCPCGGEAQAAYIGNTEQMRIGCYQCDADPDPEVIGSNPGEAASLWNRMVFAAVAATLAARDERVRELEAELAAMRPEAEAAPAPARWWCEGCGAELGHGLVSQTATDHHPAMAHPVGDAWCGPVVPVEAGS